MRLIKNRLFGNFLVSLNMKNKSLQQIEDFYLNLGYKRGKLRKVLAKDEEYQKLLKDRKRKLTQRFKATSVEKKKYVLSTDSDFEILTKCKQLEKLELSKEDRILVKLIKSQLEYNRRKPLLNTLNRLLKKYKQRL